MTDYKRVFDEAQEKAEEMIHYSDTFPEFHDNYELFHFIVAPKSQYSPDTDALEQALDINRAIAQALIDKGPSLVGNGSVTLDGVESRHILLLTNLINLIGTDWGDVLEIGGGYGNFLRLATGIVSYQSWTIIDLPYISDLQKWFLAETNTDTSRVRFNPTIAYESNDLVIGTHSLSELAQLDFTDYYERFIRKSEYLYYASLADETSFKYNIIREDFNLKKGRIYEGGRSRMLLFEHK